MLSPGLRIAGRYRVEKLVGEGGMGAVYEAYDEAEKRRIALKVILGEHARDDKQLARFQREARVAGGVETQHIARVYDAGVDETTGTPFIALEYLDGEDVSQLLRRIGPLPPELALRIIAQACVGLIEAHDRDVIHRDIKPANVFVARTDAAFIAKLVDFGIAKVKKEPTELERTRSLTQTGGLVGSPLYMSPEQAIGAKEIDARADVFSLGTVLYEMLTGRTPHEHHDTLGRLIIAICQERAAHVQDLAPWVPPKIAAIVHRALEIDAGARYPSAVAMLDDIVEALPDGWAIEPFMIRPLTEAEKERVAPRAVLRESPGVESISPFARTHRDAEPEPPRVEQRPSRARWAAVASALALLVVGGGAAFAVRPSAPRAAAPSRAVEPPAAVAANTASPAPSPQPPDPAPPPPRAAPDPRPADATGAVAHQTRGPRRAPIPKSSPPPPPSSAKAADPPAAQPPSQKLGTSDSFE